MGHPEKIPPICDRYPLTLERVEATEQQLATWGNQPGTTPAHETKYDSFLAGFIALWSTHPAGGGKEATS